MKTNLKRVLSLVCALALCIGMLPMSALAATQTGEYVTLDYENDGIINDKHIVVNVYVDDALVQKTEVEDAKRTDNHVTLTVVNDGYEIDNVQFDRIVNGEDISYDRKTYSFQRSWTGSNPLVVSVYLRIPLPQPEIPEGVYEEDATVEFRAYYPHLLKMLYLGLGSSSSITEETEINKVTVHFVESFGYGVEEDLTPVDREEDYRYCSLSNSTGLAIPRNVESLTIESSAGDVTVNAENLRFVLGWEGGLPHYSIESTNDDIHVVYFYNEDGSHTGNNYFPYAVRFVEHGKSLGDDMPPDPVYGDYNTYRFVNWEQDTWDGTGDPFFRTTEVNEDLTVFAKKVSSPDDGGSEIHVMNYEDDQLLNRVVELYNAKNDDPIEIGDIDLDSVRIRVTSSDQDKHTNEDYYNNDWREYEGDPEYYYFVHNYNTPYGIDSLTNTHVAFNEINGVIFYFNLQNGTGTSVNIPVSVNGNPGDLSKSQNALDYIIELRVIQPPDAPTEDDLTKDPTDPADTGLLGDGAVKVQCVNEDATHTPKEITYGLLTGGYTVPTDADVKWGSDGQGYGYYYVDVTVNSGVYVTAYNAEGNVPNNHQLLSGEDATKTIRLKYGKNGWEVMENAIPVTFQVTCGEQPVIPSYDIIGFDKALVTGAEEASAAGITGSYDYPENGKVTILESGSVKLLYKITVTGKEGVQFTVTDAGAELVPVEGISITAGTDTFTGTIPTGETSLAFYVSRTFTADELTVADADGIQYLVNTASVVADNDGTVDPGNSDDEEETPGEEESSGGNIATEYWIMNDLDVVKEIFEAHASDGDTMADITLRAGNVGTLLENPYNDWGAGNAYYIVKNGIPGGENYVAWDDVDQLTIWIVGEDGRPGVLHGFNGVDIRVEAPDANGVSKVYLLYDVTYNHYYRNNATSWTDIAERKSWASGEIYTVLPNEQIGGKFHPGNYTDGHGREITLLGWSSTEPDKIYKPNDTDIPALLHAGDTFTIDPGAANADNGQLSIDIYGVWGYVDTFSIDKVLTKVVRNSEEIPGDLTGITLYPGDELTWTITVYNDSAEPQTLWMRDMLEARGDSYHPIVPTVTDSDGNELSFNPLPSFTVPANGTATFYAYYTVTEKEVGLTLRNACTVDKEIRVDPTTDPTADTENPVKNPNLEVNKVADKTSAKAGETITYTVTMKNTSDQPLTNVAVSDGMWLNETVAATVCVDGEQATVSNGSITVASIKSGDTATITYQYTVTEADVNNGSIVNRVAVDGGEDGGPGGDTETVWTGDVTITPANITVYTGGAGYSGVTDEDGDVISGTETSGLPEPGYHIELPADVMTWLRNHGINDGTDLSDKLTFTYSMGADETLVTRTWALHYVGIYSTSPQRNVYSLEPITDTPPVRLLFTDSEGNEVTSDAILEMNENTVSATYTMTINPGELDQSEIKAVFTVGEESITCNIKIEPGDLIVRSVVNQDPETNTTEIAEAATGEDLVDNSITAVDNDRVTYFVNNSEVKIPVEENADRVQLLVDKVSNSGTFNAAMGEDAIDHISDSLSNATYELAYLDLVDTENGNAVVTMGDNDKLTIYWPVPDNAASNSDFHIVHYTGMDRHDEASIVGENELANAPKETPEVRTETIDGQKYVVFEADSFSPFVLVYEKEDNTDPDPGRPSRPSHRPDRDDEPEDLNTEDHVGYLIGCTDGTIRPEDDISRAEVATIFFRLLTDEARETYWSQTNSYSDVAPDAWYNNAVSTLSNMGILDGYLDGTFRPNAPITRSEFTKIAVSFFDYAAEEYSYEGWFSDVQGREWFVEYLTAAIEYGLIEGMPDGTFRPLDNITRAEAATIVNRTLGREPHEDYLLSRREMITWPDNSTSAWYYADMQEATNSHDYAWIVINEDEDDEMEVEEWTDKLDERDWAELEQTWSDAYDAPGGEVMD